jgi:hypothetical protein
MKTIKSRLILLGIVFTLIVIGYLVGVPAKAEEPKAPTVTETVTAVTEWVNDIPNKPARIQAWASAEWTDIRAYQAQGWADGKAQLNQNWETIKGFFKTTESTN